MVEITTQWRIEYAENVGEAAEGDRRMRGKCTEVEE